MTDKNRTGPHLLSALCRCTDQSLSVEKMAPVLQQIEILAHRGWWDHPAQRNTLPALQRAFAAGLGVETAPRHRPAPTPISPAPPLPGPLTLRTLLEAYAKAGRPGHLALNIKSDGLQSLVHSLLQEFSITRYFL